MYYIGLFDGCILEHNLKKVHKIKYLCFTGCGGRIILSTTGGERSELKTKKELFAIRLRALYIIGRDPSCRPIVYIITLIVVRRS